MKRHHADKGRLASELAGLPDLTRPELVERFQELYGNPPPASVSRQFLIRAIAYRMQEEIHGGLKPATQRFLRKALEDNAAGCETTAPTSSLKPGTRLLREWRGVTHEVLVLEDGVEFNGKRYRSLSEVAGIITGAHWSGPVFRTEKENHMTKIIRCAVYTRKSTEEGLEQDFNSLHAQREACEAYIISQKHEGWQIVKADYDDGGFSGGNMERPALLRLLKDIEARRIDVIVVYKVDRLTRSLADFAKIVEKFDAHGVSFVSVTQQFNTTSSMGRLTLNVLLSFAQFEREVTGERIRDKFAASKKKGMWMGGSVPLGYNVKDRKLLVNAREAETIQHIFQRYLDLGCVRLLRDDLRMNGIHSKGGSIFSRGALYKLLENPLYIGQVRHKDVCYPGQHKSIVPQELWEKVRQRMAYNAVEHKSPPHVTTNSLLGKLFDTSGERLVPVHSKKNGKRYRYYVSESLSTGPAAAATSQWRLPGQEIEQSILDKVLQLLQDSEAIANAAQEAGMEMRYLPEILRKTRASMTPAIDATKHLIKRIEVHPDGLHMTLLLESFLPKDAGITSLEITRDFPMRMKRRGVETRLVIGETAQVHMDMVLIKTVARAQGWFEDLIQGRSTSLATIAAREHTDIAYVSRVMNLAFLAPDIVESIVTGKQPADLTTHRLLRDIDLPLDWAEQRRGLSMN